MDNKIDKNNKESNLPMILLILDGWGIAKPNRGNAISLAKTPVMDKVVKDYPSTQLCASGRCVGLPSGQSGNSEAGHMNIGAGRVVDQDDVKINKSITEGVFLKNPAFFQAIKHVKKNKSKLHIMGMISEGANPHSDPEHLRSILKMVRKNEVKDVCLHLFTDGRDSPKYASLKLVESIERDLKGGEVIASIMGRFYAMDRKKKWSRTERAYKALLGDGLMAKSPQAAITESYNKGEGDEYIEPYVIAPKGKPLAVIGDGDGVIFLNLRSDRARQLAKVFVQADFSKKNPGSFERKRKIKDLLFVAMTDFGPDLDSILTAFPSADLKNTLPMVLEDLTQLYIAETEKYAHVTYFFNGGYADPVDGEDRVVIPSPDVRSYAETPVMSSEALVNLVIKNLKNKKYDFTVLNLAAPDMIGHTGNLEAGIKCCEGIDQYVGKIIEEYLKADGTVVITADHGNIEEMLNLDTEEIITEHSSNPVPFVIVNKKMKNKIKLSKKGNLGDVAPTIIDLVGRQKPKEMTGKSLINKI